MRFSKMVDFKSITLDSERVSGLSVRAFSKIRNLIALQACGAVSTRVQDEFPSVGKKSRPNAHHIRPTRDSNLKILAHTH